jgi:hypothetical protein
LFFWWRKDHTQELGNEHFMEDSNTETRAAFFNRLGGSARWPGETAGKPDAATNASKINREIPTRFAGRRSGFERRQLHNQ